MTTTSRSTSRASATVCADQTLCASITDAQAAAVYINATCVSGDVAKVTTAGPDTTATAAPATTGVGKTGAASTIVIDATLVVGTVVAAIAFGMAL